MLFQKDREPGLFEMTVCGEGLSQAAVLHDEEGNAVGEGPRLVRAVGIKLECSQPQCCIGVDNLDLRIAIKSLPQRLQAYPFLAAAKPFPSSVAADVVTNAPSYSSENLVAATAC